MRIAMWSGPRNLSTAMMYSFAARGDCAVVDEPFYAAYLKATGAAHPMAARIMQTQEMNPAKVAAQCLGQIPGNQPHYYLKLMAHHMVGGFPLAWAGSCVNVHLIRHPARVIASYAAKREDPTPEDIGYFQQLELFETLGGIVVESDDIRKNPAGMLGKLCAEIGIDYKPSMLTWAAGGVPEDGVWAAHWYGAVHQSSGFAPPEGDLPIVPERYQEVLKAVIPAYLALKSRALTQN